MNSPYLNDNISHDDVTTGFFPPEKRKKKVPKAVKIIVIVVLVFAFLIMAIVFGAIGVLKNNEAYKTAYDYISNSPEIIAKYGRNVEPKFVGGSYSKETTNGVTTGDAYFKFRIEDDVYIVELVYKNDKWVIIDNDEDYSSPDAPVELCLLEF